MNWTKVLCARASTSSKAYPETAKTFLSDFENSKPETPPMTIMSKKKSGGIGLVNVQRRLNLLYPDQYELKIHDNPKSYAVNLSIDL